MKKQIDRCMESKSTKLNNKGAALLTVIVVVTFITILATTMMYITSMNYQMKQTDYQNKKSFYKAEEALDTLKAELTKDMSRAFQEAYQEVMVQYAYLENDTRKIAFKTAFLDKLKEIWDERKTSAETLGRDLTNVLQDLTPGYERNFISPQAGEEAVSLACDEEGRFIIQNVRVRYVENGYSSYIKTDIALCVPDLDLEHNSSSNNAWNLSSAERETVVLTDYIIYMNWTKY